MKKHKFSCFLIGEESLLIQCAKKIMDSGHLILGVVSSNEQIKKWAPASRIRFISVTAKEECHLTHCFRLC